MFDRARNLVHQWLPCYPSLRPWIDDQARAALRHSEDDWLQKFAGLDALTRKQVRELIDWKWTANAARWSKSQHAVDDNDDWSHASECIRTALAAAGSDDIAAVNALRGKTGGIPDWETAMASVVLAACRPAQYTVVDSRVLRTMMLLEGRSQSQIQKMGWFPPSRWPGYLGTCRNLSEELGVRLRDLDRAFWMAAGRDQPACDYGPLQED